MCRWEERQLLVHSLLRIVSRHNILLHKWYALATTQSGIIITSYSGKRQAMFLILLFRLLKSASSMGSSTRKGPMLIVSG